MTALGAQPTKTAVRITSSTGNHADIEAASEALAGVMTPEHVKTLRGLSDWKRGIEQGDDAGHAETDIITRKELAEALAKAAHPLFVATPDDAVIPDDPRIDAMETRISALETRSTASLQALSNRLQSVESSARRAGSGLTSGETEKLVASLIDSKLALAPGRGVGVGNLSPELTTLGARLDDLAAKITRLDLQPELAPDSREHLTQMFAALADLNERVASIETVLATLKMLAAYKAEATTEAA